MAYDINWDDKSHLDIMFLNNISTNVSNGKHKCSLDNLFKPERPVDRQVCEEPRVNPCREKQENSEPANHPPQEEVLEPDSDSIHGDMKMRGTLGIRQISHTCVAKRLSRGVPSPCKSRHRHPCTRKI
eukprot:172690-Amorphochlora_amoeboformis.AAC.1